MVAWLIALLDLAAPRGYQRCYADFELEADLLLRMRVQCYWLLADGHERTSQSTSSSPPALEEYSQIRNEEKI
jgi:hypothetical protein